MITSLPLRDRFSGDFRLIGALDSLVSLETNYIIEQYRQAVAGSDDRFGYLYILNIIRHNYSPDLDPILAKLLENRYGEVRLEATSVVGELGVVKLFGHCSGIHVRPGNGYSM